MDKDIFAPAIDPKRYGLFGNFPIHIQHDNMPKMSNLNAETKTEKYKS